MDAMVNHKAQRVELETSHRFAWQIATGLKRQTARRTLKCIPGDVIAFNLPLYGACGLYYEKAEFVCKSVSGIIIDYYGIVLDGAPLNGDEAQALARADGFIDLREWQDWMFAKYQLREFHGFLIKW